MINVCTEFFDQALHDRQVRPLSCEAEGRGTIWPRLVNVGTQLFDQTLHDRQVSQLSGIMQGR